MGSAFPTLGPGEGPSGGGDGAATLLGFPGGSDSKEPACNAGDKIAGRNINNLRYADNTTLMAESEEELKSLLMTVQISHPGGVFVWKKLEAEGAGLG